MSCSLPKHKEEKRLFFFWFVFCFQYIQNCFWPQFHDTVSHGKEQEFQSGVKWKDFLLSFDSCTLLSSITEQHGLVIIMRQASVFTVL